MKTVFYLILAGVLCITAHEGYGQFDRMAIKRQNKRVGYHFRGKKQRFGIQKRYNALGFAFNAFNYYGDLSPLPRKVSTDLTFTRPAIGFSFMHRFGPRYSVTAAFTTGTLSGSDARSQDKNDTKDAVFRYNRNLSFRNRIQELSAVASLDLVENMSTYMRRANWTPYVYLGLAVLHHNPRAKAPDTFLDGSPNPNGGKWVALQPLGTEGQNASLDPGDVNYRSHPYRRIQPAIPFGLGARFRINNVVDISGEVGFRYLFTDYIDDVSKNYVDPTVFGNNKLAQAMAYRSNELTSNQPNRHAEEINGQTFVLLPGYGKEHPDNMRGNSNDRDTYMVTSIKLTYIVGKNFHRPKTSGFRRR